MKVFELFAGIGAPRAALKRAGILHQSVGFSEIDKYAIKSYCAIHDESELKNYGDITKIEELPPTDLLFHGSPCQSFSIAGKGLGGDEGSGTNSSLMWETVRLIDKSRPTYVIWENVKGALSQKHRHNFDKYLEQMKAFGYNNYWQVLNTKHYGVPQNRERVFCVSILKTADSGTFSFPKPFDNGIRLKHLLETNVAEKYYISDEKCAKLLMQLNMKEYDQCGQMGCKLDKPYVGDKFTSLDDAKVKDMDCEYAATVTARYYKGIGGNGDNMVCVPCLTPDRIEKRQNGRRFKEDGDPSFTLTSQDKHGVLLAVSVENGGVVVKEATKKGYAVACPGDSINLEQPNSTTRRGRVGKEVAQTLTCSCNQAVVEPLIIDDIYNNREPRIYNECPCIRSERTGLKVAEPNECKMLGMIDIKGTEQIRRVYDPNGLCPTITTMCGGHQEPKVYVKYRIRKLTAKECFRLQGFSDSDFEKAESVCSSSQLYKQAGNSITVDVLVYIFKQLFEPQEKVFEIGEQISII